MPLEPLRLDLAVGHLPGEDDLEGALAEADGRYPGGFCEVVGGFRGIGGVNVVVLGGGQAKVVFSHAVEPVAAPVELLL